MLVSEYGEGIEGSVGSKASRLLRLRTALSQVGATVPPLACVPASAYDRHVAFVVARTRRDGAGEGAVSQSRCEARSGDGAGAAEGDEEATCERVRCAMMGPGSLESETTERLRGEVKAFLESERLMGTDGGVALAVRSSCLVEDSATCSCAGMFETILNVRGTDQVMEAIKAVWASAWSPQVPLNLRGKPHTRMAVILQAHVTSEISGVAFTCDPVYGDTSVVVVDAVPGHGHGIVSGEVTPDHFVISKSQRRVVSWAIGTRTGAYFPDQVGLLWKTIPPTTLPVLSEEQAVIVANASLRVEELFASIPQDIEFSFNADGKLYLLQARPVTSCHRLMSWEPPLSGVKYLLETNFFNKPLAELFATVMSDAVTHAATEAYDVYGASEHWQMHLFNNFFYLFVEKSKFSWEERLPLQEAAIASKKWLIQFQEWNKILKPQLIERHIKLQSQNVSKLTNAELAEHLRECAYHYSNSSSTHSKNGRAPEILMGFMFLLLKEICSDSDSPQKVVTVIENRMLRAGHSPNIRFPELQLLYAAFQASPEATFRLKSSQDPVVIDELAGGSYPHTHIPQDCSCVQVRHAMQRFLSHHSFLLLGPLGHDACCLGDLKESMLAIVKSSLDRPVMLGQDIHDVKLSDFEEDPIYISLLESIQPKDRERFQQMLVEAGAVHTMRNERNLYCEAWAGGILKAVILEAAGRLHKTGGLASIEHAFHARVDELASALTNGESAMRHLFESSSQRYALHHELTLADAPPSIFWKASSFEEESNGKNNLGPVDKAMLAYVDARGRGKFIPKQIRKEEGEAIVLLSGIPASPGCAIGTACHLPTPSSIPCLLPGDIAVIVDASPAFSAALTLCSAALSEQGGQLCHMAISARELRIPAVVGLGKGLSWLHGHQVSVDGAAGTVRVLTNEWHPPSTSSAVWHRLPVCQFPLFDISWHIINGTLEHTNDLSQIKRTGMYLKVANVNRVPYITFETSLTDEMAVIPDFASINLTNVVLQHQYLLQMESTITISDGGIGTLAEHILACHKNALSCFSLFWECGVIAASLLASYLENGGDLLETVKQHTSAISAAKCTEILAQSDDVERCCLSLQEACRLPPGILPEPQNSTLQRLIYCGFITTGPAWSILSRSLIKAGQALGIEPPQQVLDAPSLECIIDALQAHQHSHQPSTPQLNKLKVECTRGARQRTALSHNNPPAKLTNPTSANITPSPPETSQKAPVMCWALAIGLGLC